MSRPTNSPLGHWAVRLLLAACAVCACAPPLRGATLSFNQALLVGDTLQTVPAGKVWKVESLHGRSTATECRQTLESGISRFFSAFGFQINGEPHYVTLNPSDSNWYPSANCTGAPQNSTCILCCDGQGTRWCTTNCTGVWIRCQPAGADVIYDKVAFPIWLPAGSTLRTLGAGSKLSVLEFNVTP